MIQENNRKMSFSNFISALAVSDTIVLLIGKKTDIYLFHQKERHVSSTSPKVLSILFKFNANIMKSNCLHEMRSHLLVSINTI